MGYANEPLDRLGATPSVLSPAAFKALIASRAPVTVKVAAPPTPSLFQRAVAALQPKPAAPVVSIAMPRITPPAAPAGTPTTAQTAAPLVAAAATPLLGPIAAAIPPIVDAAAQPSPVRIRVASAVTDLAPSTGTAAATGPEVYNADGTPATDAAAVASSGNVFDQLKQLPPAVLIGGAVVSIFLLSRGGRRRR